MRIPESLAPLFDYGILDEVVRPLMSGKEAQVFVVISGGEQCVAKVYKEAQNRSFKQRAEYTEGRNVRNSRDQRAMQKRSKHGREQDEAAWRSTEVDMIHRLHAGGVRVPTPHHFVDGVLIMEMIVDGDGNPAPRLADLAFTPEKAVAMYELLLREVIRMLCAGVVHGDLSDFNVLIGANGPVIIDFPQSVDTAKNSNARKLLLRDVDNLHRFLSNFVPNARRLPYAEEMWELFQQNALTPEVRLTGRYRPAERRANTQAVLELIQDANYDERKRREGLGLRGGPPAGSGGSGERGPQEHRGPARPPQGRPPQQQRDGQPRGGQQQQHGGQQQPQPQQRGGQQQQPRGGQPQQQRGGQQQQPRGGQPQQQRGGQPQQQQRGGQQQQPRGQPQQQRGGQPQQDQRRPQQGQGTQPARNPQPNRGGRSQERTERKPVEVIVTRRSVPR